MQGKGEEGAVQELLRKIEERFGIRIDTEAYHIFPKRKGEFWITSREVAEEELPFPHRAGFKFAQVFSRGGFRLSTHAIQLFGRRATRNVVEVNERERELFIRGEDLPNRWEVKGGQVIVRYRGFPLGSAVASEDRLKNQVPTARRIKAPWEDST